MRFTIASNCDVSCSRWFHSLEKSALRCLALSTIRFTSDRAASAGECLLKGCSVLSKENRKLKSWLWKRESPK